MRDNKLHTPEGVKDFLPDEYAFKIEIENRLLTVFHSYGYLSVCSPALEYVEVFEGKGSTNIKQTYKFIDRDGEILTLRSDMTPPVARIAATCFNREQVPIRLCYVGNNFKYNESHQGKQREFTQAGVELIGIGGDDASAEVLAIAIKSLQASGLKDFRLDVGQARFLEGVLEEAGLNASERTELYKLVLDREFTAVDKYIIGKNIPPGIKKVLSELPFLTGGTEIIGAARELVNGERSLYALDNLENIYNILTDYGLSDYVLFDLSMVGHLDYYTGIIFRGYTYGTGFTVLDGGRYDNLLSNFGKSMSSVGFAVKVNDLVSALENQNLIFSPERVDTLLAFAPEGRSMALSVGDRLRSQGVMLENSLLSGDIMKNIEYAEKKGYGGLLYFPGNGNVTVINLRTGEQNETSIETLFNKEQLSSEEGKL